MTVLLTGATGFIGSHVARVLVHAGHDVVATLRDGSDLWRIEDVVSAIELVRCDVRSSDDVQRCVDRIRPEVCVHLAWCVEPGQYLWSLENFDMLTASVGLASRLARHGCRRFVGVGTCLEYDTRLGYLAEQSGLDPRTPYAATKLAAQVAIGQLGAVTGMAAAWARLFYQYGPFEDPRRLVPSVIRAALAGRTVDVTSGEQVRDFLHVEDVARALVAIATSDVVGAVNVGSGRPITVRDLVMTLAELLGRGEFVAFGARAADQADPPFVCANSHRLRASTGWAPRFDLVDGLCDTVKWWRTRVEVRTSQGVRS